MKRVVVVGTTGAGKTTFAKRLAATLNVPHVELDALHWGPDWTPTPDFRQRVEVGLAEVGWVVDGNYSAVRDLIWTKADTVVWLDYTFGTKLRRLFRRTSRRLGKSETLWNGNTETFRAQFWSRDSLFIWYFKTHWKQRRRYEQLMKNAAYSHLEFIRLFDPHEAERLLSSFNQVSQK